MGDLKGFFIAVTGHNKTLVSDGFQSVLFSEKCKNTDKKYEVWDFVIKKST